MANIAPRQHRLSSKDLVMAPNWTDLCDLYSDKPPMLSLPSNDDPKSLLTLLSTRLTNRYLVTRVIPYSGDPDSSTIRYVCDIAKPFVWYRNEGTGSASEERSGDELTTETEGDQNDGR